MKAPRPAKDYTVGTLADPAFRYRRSYDTDIRRTIATAKRGLARAVAQPADQPDLCRHRAQVAA